MVIQIDAIKVKKRVRSDLGDLKPLKDSLRRYGLLNPIVISESYELIAGERRLEAVKQLGWESIPATILGLPDKISRLEIELEENTVRKNFTDEELLQGYQALEKLKNPSFFTRLKKTIKYFFSKSFDIKENRKKAKRKRNALLSLLLVAGLILIIIASVFYHTFYISAVLNTLLDIIGIALIIPGAFYTIKYIRGFLKS